MRRRSGLAGVTSDVETVCPDSPASLRPSWTCRVYEHGRAQNVSAQDSSCPNTHIRQGQNERFLRLPLPQDLSFKGHQFPNDQFASQGLGLNVRIGLDSGSVLFSNCQ